MSTIQFPCSIKFTIHTHSGTYRTAVWMCMDQAEVAKNVEFYKSDTTGETKYVTYEVYVKP